ncbi:hypothetical protein C8F04DRAFT_1277593 [Mycena alexandri]|uniref:Uncharacterized protein n=1 Tax=Mycena alexandri TaxID=1745969 RepID=A0AAD6RZQ3_9AGAR|nr:hypothetical protein C8F04DRAFT_1277593 [Mycena alexandri]
MTSKHSHTGVAYPSRPLDAPNDGHFACSVPLYTHTDFTNLAAHNIDNRRKWHFLKHPLRPAVCSDLGSLKSYMRELNDPEFPPEKHNDPALVVGFHTALEIARAIYKCTTQGGPARHSGGGDNPLTSSSAPFSTTQGGAVRRGGGDNGGTAIADAINQLKRPLESTAAPAAHQKRPRKETVHIQAIAPDAFAQDIMTYRNAVAANSAPSAPTDTARFAADCAPSSPTDTACAPSSPADTARAVADCAPSAPTPAVSAGIKCEVTAPMSIALTAAASASQGAGPVAGPEVDPESEEEEGPYFYFAHGPVYLDPKKAAKEIRTHREMLVVNTLAEVQDLWRKNRRAKKAATGR